MMVASVGGILKTILWIFIISGIIRFVVRLTANYAVNRVNEEVKNNQRAQSNTQNDRAKQSSGNKTPDSEYVDFVEIKDQE
jgi:hypothetical protein